MKKNFIIIIFLMGLSLLGIMFIQWFWMQKAISVKEEQFDRTVNEALARAAFNVERNKNAMMLSNMFASFGINPNFPNNPMQQSVSSDSIISGFNDYWPGEIAPNQQGIITEDGNEISLETTEKNGIKTVTYGFDTVIVSGNSQQHIQRFSSISTPNGNLNIIPQSNLPQWRGEDFEMMRNQLGSVMDQMFYEFSIRDIPIEEKVNKSMIEPELKNELRNLNIPLAFEYGVSDARHTWYKKLQSNNFSTKHIKETYKTSLFPNDMMRSTEQLHIYFPAKRAYIFKSLNWLLVGSILFTLIILITFYYTLKTILNQKKVSEIKTDFINNMTHEFKTPIATISLAADAISNPLLKNDSEKIQRFTSIIKEENKRMNRQVESVLQMSLLDKKDFNLNHIETDIHPLIEQTIKNISIQVEQKGGLIDYEPLAIQSMVEIDETHFVNIIFNLLDNANKYTFDRKPEIKVKTETKGEFLLISIADNGIGMDKETQDRIFDKFYRYSTGDVHTVKGFGLGLSYVKAIIMALNGNISVKSTKGKGSTFYIQLPLKN